MHDHQIVDAGLAQRALPPGDDGCKGRHGLEVVLVGEAQFVLIHRIAAHADAERVKHRFAVAVSEFIADRFERHQAFIGDRHGRIPFRFWMALAISEAQSRGFPQESSRPRGRRY
jgi:hypothetical protein